MLLIDAVIAHADSSCVGTLFSVVCLCVCLSVFPHDISKTDAARITKLDIDMVYLES